MTYNIKLLVYYSHRLNTVFNLCYSWSARLAMINCWDVLDGLKVLQHEKKYQSECRIVIYSTWVMLRFSLAWQQRGNKQRSSEKEVDGCSLPVLTTVSRWEVKGRTVNSSMPLWRHHWVTIRVLRHQSPLYTFIEEYKSVLSISLGYYLLKQRLDRYTGHAVLLFPAFISIEQIWLPWKQCGYNSYPRLPTVYLNFNFIQISESN